MVLKANGSKLPKGENFFQVCSLRCAGIYGEGERRHLPRIVVSYYISSIIVQEFLLLENFELMLFQKLKL